MLHCYVFTYLIIFIHEIFLEKIDFFFLLEASKYTWGFYVYFGITSANEV